MISSFLRFISNCLMIVILKSYLRDFRCVGGACGGADPWKLITINQLLEADKPDLRFRGKATPLFFGVFDDARDRGQWFWEGFGDNPFGVGD